MGEFSVRTVSQGFERWPEGLHSSVGSCEQRGEPGDDKKVLNEGGRQEAPSMHQCQPGKDTWGAEKGGVTERPTGHMERK